MEQIVNGKTRKINFKPAFHKVEEGYGVHGMEIMFVLKGEEGAAHFIMYTGMELKKTREWHKEQEHPGTNYMFPMGVDVGYHSPYKMFDSHEVTWPTKMRKTGPEPLDVAFDKIGDAPPVCEHIGVPCFTDGSALRADEWTDVFVAEGEDKIWAMLEEYYEETFNGTN